MNNLGKIAKSEGPKDRSPADSFIVYPKSINNKTDFPKKNLPSRSAAKDGARRAEGRTSLGTTF